MLGCICCCFKRRNCVKRRADRLKRHNDASDKLKNEIDIVKLLYVQRVGQFIAKLILKKHQRALVTSFKKYQVDDLSRGGEVSGGEALGLLEPSIQEDGTVDLLSEFTRSGKLTEDQMKLLREIADQFSVEDSAADLSILFEVTGFQGDSDNFQFWENYVDFEELGDTNLVREDKDEDRLAHSKKTSHEDDQ